MEFAKLLTEKLQRVLDEQNHNEIMRSKLSAMSEVRVEWRCWPAPNLLLVCCGLSVELVSADCSRSWCVSRVLGD